MNAFKQRLLFAAGLSLAATVILPASASAQSHDYDHSYRGDHYAQSKQWDKACNNESERHGPEASDVSLVDTLAQDGRFTTLVAAVKAAGLVDALNTADQKTVFAPTDEAFAKLPAGTVETLVADPATLANILTYHVVAGAVDSETAIEAGEAVTLNGQSVQIGEGDDGNVYVNDSVLEQTDIYASNGIVHVIDSVLMPKM